MVGDRVQCAGIARKQSQNRSSFTDRAVYDKFDDWLLTAPRYPFKDTAPLLQCAMVQSWFKEHGQDNAAEWFERNMTGRGEENWMLAHVGSSVTNGTRGILQMVQGCNYGKEKCMPLRDLRDVISPTTSFILRVKQACKDRHLVTELTNDQIHEIHQEVGERLRLFEAVRLDTRSGQAAKQNMVRL